MDNNSEKNTESPRYIEAIGRRKTAAARVRIVSGGSGLEINGKTLAEYFKTDELRRVAMEALRQVAPTAKFKISAVIKGGGVSAQAEALRHGIARALVAFDGELRKKAKKLKFLRRDPRAKERRKFGLKKARKAPQWAKR